MTLTGPQSQQIQDALLAAFDRAELAQLVKFKLGENLDAIAGGDDLRQIVFNLVQWADRNGRALDLIHGALAANPANPQLQPLQHEASNWHLEPPEAGKSPYQGLQYFDVEDAYRFFGREKLTAHLVDYLRDHRLLAVIGASGSGKSSVVRAGVVAVLARGEALADGTLPPKGSTDWLVHILTPTAHPLKALSASLTKGSESVTVQATLMDDMTRDARSVDLFVARMLAASPAEHLLLVVDQFEELFTLCKDPAARKAFVDNLLTAAQPDGLTTVIITLRADFYHRCAEFDDLRMALANGQTYSDGNSWIEAMSDDEFREAIEKPAADGDWDFEPGLVDVMLADVEHEPGALPLLSHALLETWNNRRGRTMTFAGYYEAGGVKGAIATRADAEFNELDADEQAVARNIFVRLTELGEGSEDTRRRISREESLGTGKDAETVTKVLTTLGYARLITTDQYEVQVAHEALIREWPTLRGWLEEDREGQLIHRRLIEAAQIWDEQGKNSSDLYQGTRLYQAMDWAETGERSMNDLEDEFLNASWEPVRSAIHAQRRINRELGVTVMVISMIFLLTFFQSWITIMGIKLAEDILGIQNHVGINSFLSISFTTVFLGVVFASYTGRMMSFSGGFSLSLPSQRMLQFLSLAMLNIYLIVGTLWYYQDEFGYPVHNFLNFKLPLSIQTPVMVQYLPPRLFDSPVYWVIPVIVFLALTIRK